MTATALTRQLGRTAGALTGSIVLAEHPGRDGALRFEYHGGSGVEIDGVARRARVEAGAVWADVIEPTAEQGFVVLHGASPDVGVVRYTTERGRGR